MKPIVKPWTEDGTTLLRLLFPQGVSGSYSDGGIEAKHCKRQAPGTGTRYGFSSSRPFPANSLRGQQG
jgi:hypothetical protein